MKILPIILVLLVTACSTTNTYNPSSEIDWSLIAKSHIIATGQLSAPIVDIQKCLTSNEHKYIELIVKCDRVLKGNVKSDFTIRWYSRPENYRPSPKSIIAYNEKKVLVFLTQIDTEAVSIPGFPTLDQPAKSELFFAGYTPYSLCLADANFIKQIQQEITYQQGVLERFEELYPPMEIPFYKKVKQLIDATTQENTQMAAFRNLEELGLKAVPAIILLMDDRRDLAVSSISLRNDPNHWEAIRHYGPKMVVDAMDAILNQITRESYGSISNGGSERARTEAINGWRIYLHKTHNKGIYRTR